MVGAVAPPAAPALGGLVMAVAGVLPAADTDLLVVVVEPPAWPSCFFHAEMTCSCQALSEVLVF